MIKFTRTGGGCPSYKDYYIKDKFAGYNVYGHDVYDYTLYKKQPKKVLHFKKNKQAYNYIKSLGVWITKDMSKFYSDTLENKELAAIIDRDGTVYRVLKDTSTLEIIPPPVQLTPWYNNYIDCLNASKELIESLEQESRQLTLNDFIERG
ncbi:MAG: hypothetical protein J6M62_07250 [Selenomonadaceae bacterium]|nr:hypothetical protein [Selenomonadaceae bacterium]